MEELSDQVDYLLSIKYQAQSSLVTQIMQFKTEALLSRNRDGLDVVVDEIISSYNHKSEDHLEFDEM